MIRSRTGGCVVRIRDRQCETCIYRPYSPLRERLPALEAEIADPRMPGHFRGARACHSADWPATDTICAGFAERHGDDCTPIQIARRLEAMRIAAENRSRRSRTFTGTRPRWLPNRVDFRVGARHVSR